MLMLLLRLLVVVVVHPWSRAIGVMTITVASGEVDWS